MQKQLLPTRVGKLQKKQVKVTMYIYIYIYMYDARKYVFNKYIYIYIRIINIISMIIPNKHAEWPNFSKVDSWSQDFKLTFLFSQFFPMIFIYMIYLPTPSIKQQINKHRKPISPRMIFKLGLWKGHQHILHVKLLLLRYLAIKVPEFNSSPLRS